MKTTKRFFLGRDDPDRIMLEHVFPAGDLVFSTPLEEAGSHQRVVIEGGEPFLDFIAQHVQGLTQYDERNPDGRWTAVVPYGEDQGIELFYEPSDRLLAGLRLIVFVLRRDLVQACDLKLSPIAQVTVTLGHITCLYQDAPLPEDIGNGQIELPRVIVPPPRLN